MRKPPEEHTHCHSACSNVGTPLTHRGYWTHRGSRSTWSAVLPLLLGRFHISHSLQPAGLHDSGHHGNRRGNPSENTKPPPRADALLTTCWLPALRSSSGRIFPTPDQSIDGFTSQKSFSRARACEIPHTAQAEFLPRQFLSEPWCWGVGQCHGGGGHVTMHSGGPEEDAPPGRQPNNRGSPQLAFSTDSAIPGKQRVWSCSWL